MATRTATCTTPECQGEIPWDGNCVHPPGQNRQAERKCPECGVTQRLTLRDDGTLTASPIPTD